MERRKGSGGLVRALILASVFGGLISPYVTADPGVTTRVSVDSGGAQANNFSVYSSVSGNGRFVAFTSLADNLVPGDTNGALDVFVHDRETGATTRVSLDSTGGQGNGHSGFGSASSISFDGRVVAFASEASNLVPGDTNGVRDMFVHDRQTGATTRASVNSEGVQGNAQSVESPTISPDGRFVAFASEASNLVPGDTNGSLDAFLHDRQTATTTRVSVGVVGQANNMSLSPSISADSRFIAFASLASNLVPGDTNGVFDVFVRDRVSGATRRVSVTDNGGEANDESGWSISTHFRGLSLSTNGRFVTFVSAASNLVAGDTNEFWDVFVHDRQTQRTIRGSLDDKGGQANGHNLSPSISADGRFIAFASEATNLAPDSNGPFLDVFVRDLQRQLTTLVSVDNTGRGGNSASLRPSMSHDARFLSFDSGSTNLVPGDTNGFDDVFIHDRGPQPSLISCGGQVATLVGTDGNDTIPGTSGRDVIHALAGDDAVNGASGDDVICGGLGDDLIDGGDGNDRVQGQAGKDVLAGGFGNDRLVGGGGNDALYGDSGNDDLKGGSGDDAMNGGTGNDVCDGGAGLGDTAATCESVSGVP